MHTYHKPNNMRTLIMAFLATAVAGGAIYIFAEPERPLFTAERGRMIVFPGDSLNLSEMTFTVDGDTVTREQFFSLDRRMIRSLIVTPAPANLIEVETRRAAMMPLEPDSLPADMDYIVDGTIVDRAAFSSVPSESIVSIAIFKGERPRMEVTTKRAPKRTNE